MIILQQTNILKNRIQLRHSKRNFGVLYLYNIFILYNFLYRKHFLVCSIFIVNFIMEHQIQTKTSVTPFSDVSDSNEIIFR